VTRDPENSNIIFTNVFTLRVNRHGKLSLAREFRHARRSFEKGALLLVTGDECVSAVLVEMDDKIYMPVSLGKRRNIEYVKKGHW